MFKSQFIKKSSALFLLVLIALATTPKLVLHNILANHKDTSYRVNNDGHAKLENEGINCHIQDLVVEVPFVNHSLPYLEVPVTIFKSAYSESVTAILSLTEFYFQLRGPPSIA